MHSDIWRQHAARPLPFPRRQADRIHLALHAAAQNALVHPHHQARAREPPARHTPPDEPNEAEAAELLAAAGFDTEHLAGGLHEDDLAQLPNDPTRDWSVPLPDAVPSEWRTYTGAQIRACVAQWAEEHENQYRAEAPDTRLFLPVDVFHPSEAKPSQRPLIGLVLLTLHAWWRWAIDAGEAHTRGQRLPPAPQAVRAIVQGRPGTGKSWMIKTICNMVRQLTKDMGSCRTFGPTGTSASAIGGETVHRAAAPPMKKKDLHKPPQPLGVGCVTSAARVSALQRRFGPLWALLDDEFSMKAREMLGWLDSDAARAGLQMSPHFVLRRRETAKARPTGVSYLSSSRRETCCSFPRLLRRHAGTLCARRWTPATPSGATSGTPSPGTTCSSSTPCCARYARPVIVCSQRACFRRPSFVLM